MQLCAAFVLKHIFQWLYQNAERRNFFEKELEKSGMKRKLFLFGFLIVGIVCVLLLWNKETVEVYTEKSVSLEEVKEELRFGLYEEKDWAAFFSVYHREELTGKILTELLTELGVKDYIVMEKMGSRYIVTREEWNNVYAQILDLLDMEQCVQTEKVLILEVISDTESNTLITEDGAYTTVLPVSFFSEWNAYEIYAVNGRCMGVAGSSEEEFYIENAYLKKAAEDGITFLYGGASYKKNIGRLGAEVKEGVCDIVIQKGEICALRMKQDTIQGEFLSYDEYMIEIRGYGKLKHTENIPVYQIYGDVIEKKLSDVVLGNTEATYIVGGEQVCAILIGQPTNFANIRVLLLAEDGTNFRSEVYLQCDTNAALTCGDKTEKLAAETVVSAAEYLSADSVCTIVVTPDSEDGAVTICDANGKTLSNPYFGTMEVRCSAEGYTLVNEVALETYLTAVVPSEMPSSYEPEALKAQAVCARSYAYMQLMRGDMAEFGAHINDGTSYQVYNKVAATDASKAAVYETAGQMLLYEGNPIEAFYFSTSMGYTDTEKVWNVEDTYHYLKSVFLNTEGSMTDLSEDAAFLSYISQPGQGYDSDVKYYRWSAEADYREKTDKINQLLVNRHAVSPKHIQFFKAGSKEALEDISAGTVAELGKVTGISSVERSSAGAILTLRIQYENGKALVKNEYNIRNILGCGIKKIVYADDTESTSVSMLPSAFCAITKQKDGTILLRGGGYGHGLGMSQNAANGMAKAGMNYIEILQYFYQDIMISGVE